MFIIKFFNVFVLSILGIQGEQHKEELESMKTNKIWDLVVLPTGRRPIGNKWQSKDPKHDWWEKILLIKVE